MHCFLSCKYKNNALFIRLLGYGNSGRMCKKITFIGLNGSGRSSYIPVMAQSLSRGFRLFNGQMLNVGSTTLEQAVQLRVEYQRMKKGKWPLGTLESINYNFYCSLGHDLITEFNIKDYRGGLLDTCDEDEIEEQEDLFYSFENSDAILFFIGADDVRNAQKNDDIRIAKIDYLLVIYEHLLWKGIIESKTPIMVVISKSDLLSDIEKKQAKDFVLSALHPLFGPGSNLMAAIVMINLGRKLKRNEQCEMEGELFINPTQGNIYVPFLFSLFCIISNMLKDNLGKLKSVQLSDSIVEGEIRPQMSENLFVNFFLSKEYNNYESNKEIVSEKNILGILSGTISKIKSILLSEVDVYINGVKQ